MTEEHKVLFVEWCAADALGGMTQMKPMTELAYRRIIDMIYSTNDHLLDDDDVLQYSTKTGAKWKAIKKELIEVHEKIYVEDGRIRNRKCSFQLQKSAQNIAQKSAAAKAKHAKDKALKEKETGLAAAPASGHAAAPANAHANQEPKNPSKKEVADDAGARSLFSLGEQLAEIIGWKDDPNWFGDYSRLQVWLDANWSFELDILPVITQVTHKRKGQGPPRNLKYYDQAIADHHARRMKPLPKGNENAAPAPRQPSRHATMLDDEFAAYAEAARLAKLQGSGGVGTPENGDG